MFGESESESPRIPSPWDSLMSIPPAATPASRKSHSPSPLAVELIPKLVPESDDGNVEYKLQLLNPSPARFARLVTQLKWRLLEGGGQAYYELGVADSGELVGLTRDEIEQSLETLEMMAGEIGASVIVVKEIEVPASLATITMTRKRRISESNGTPSSVSSTDCGDSTNVSVTETETEDESFSGTDAEECRDLERTVILSRDSENTEAGVAQIFAMDSETEDVPNVADSEDGVLSAPSQPVFDLEISSVFKPRPMKIRSHHESHLLGGRNKRNKKKQFDFDKNVKHPVEGRGPQKMDQRRHNRDRRREAKRKTLEAHAMLRTENAHQDTAMVPTAPGPDTLVNDLKMLHVTVVEEVRSDDIGAGAGTTTKTEDLVDDSDIFVSPKVGPPPIPTFTAAGESHLHVDPAVIAGVVDVKFNGDGKETKSLIVEALVVRKMSHQEAFLDFGGFSIA